MNTFKNLIIAVLTGLLALTLLTQPAQSAGTSKEAKAIEYAQCLDIYLAQSLGENKISYLPVWITSCAKYRP